MSEPDHERIWLQSEEDAGDQEEGRLWCQDNVWSGDATQYVRADLFDRRGDKIIELSEERNKLASELDAKDKRIAELEAGKAQYAEIASKAIKFQLGDIYVESRGLNVWVVSNGSSVRNTLGEWEWEPMPSNRSDDFIARTRLPFSDAWELARALSLLLNKEDRNG